eukprot:TRINITY_DN2341_c0_g1_i1.p1 TRINITY_DN2341_c0_g1~~TRINITY_DN2341_c0_g1_i1.p1  ORF type:complete len:377 (-),score=39.76 TRINITY_DN2341_c0_g1_i1:214-1344(-)
MKTYVYGWYIAGFFSILAIISATWLIYKHLRNYTQPRLQRYIVRILIMVPIYSIDSFLSLRYVRFGLWWNLGRDCYQGYTIYCFFWLILEYANIATNEKLAEVWEQVPPIKHPFPMRCITFQPGEQFLLTCRRCVLQFVLVKPLISLTSLFLDIFDLYDDGNLSPRKGYLWLTIIENISITFALYYLVLFYMAAEKELKAFKPMGKFLCIKAVVFFSFWQGVVIAALSYFGVIGGIDDWSVGQVGNGLQALIICIEMFFISIAHAVAFSYAPFRDKNKKPFLWDAEKKRFFNNPRTALTPVMKGFRNVADVRDVVAETKETFFTPLLKRDKTGRIVEDEEGEEYENNDDMDLEGGGDNHMDIEQTYSVTNAVLISG